MASINGPASPEIGSVGRSGERFDADPPLRMKLRSISRAREPIFRNVNPFWTTAPYRIPKQLSAAKEPSRADRHDRLRAGGNGEEVAQIQGERRSHGCYRSCVDAGECRPAVQIGRAHV